MSDPRDFYPTPPSPADRERFLAAAKATPEANTLAGAWEAIVPFIAEPVDALIQDGQLSLERVVNDVGEISVMRVQLAGCAGSVWEHNERISDKWPSPADPAADTASRTMLPPVSVLTGADGNPAAALQVGVRDRAHIAELIKLAAEPLNLKGGARRLDLAEDLALNGQRTPCMLVPQLYRTDAGSDYWAWPAATGNNRSKARLQLLEVGLSDLVCEVADVAVWLVDWAEKRNAELAQNQDTDLENSATRGLNVAVVETLLVVGTPTPHLLFDIVQAQNVPEHVYPPEPYDALPRYRSLGKSVIRAYRSKGLIDAVKAEVLLGQRPTTDLPDCPASASASVQRDLREQLLLSELFPPPYDPRRSALRQVFSEPSSLTQYAVNERLRAWSALSSLGFAPTVAWNPRVGDAVVSVDAARAGIGSGTPLVELLSVATADEDALRELMWRRAPHLLAAYGLIEAPRGSQDDGERRRRSSINVAKALLAQPERALELIREVSAATDTGRQPQRIGESGLVESKASDRRWFDAAFTKESGDVGGNQRPGIGTGRRSSEGRESEPRRQRKTPVEKPPSMIAQDYKGYVKNFLDKDLAGFVNDLPRLLSEVRQHSAAAGIAEPWRAEEAEYLLDRADGLAESLCDLLKELLPQDHPLREN